MKIQHIDRAKELAGKLQNILKADFCIDLPRSQALSAIAAGCGAQRWDALPATIKNSTADFRAEAAAKNLETHNIAYEIALKATQAALPYPADHAAAADIAKILKGSSNGNVRSLATKAGVLVHPHIVRVTHDVAAIVAKLLNLIEQQKDNHLPPEFDEYYPVASDMIANPNDGRIVGLTVEAIIYWAECFIRDNAHNPQMHRTDTFPFAHRIMRSVKAKDVAVLAELAGRIPRPDYESIIWEIGEKFIPVLIGRLIPGIESPSAPPLTISPTSPEPKTHGILMRNWGPRWRRIDSPDIITTGQAHSLPILETGWIKITSDLNDPDLKRFVTEAQIHGEIGDVDDTYWIVGLGSRSNLVAPLGCMRCIRDASAAHKLHILIESIHDGDETTLQSMAYILALQTCDDMQAILERDKKLDVSVSSIGTNGSDDPKARLAIESLSLIAQSIGSFAHQHSIRLVDPENTPFSFQDHKYEPAIDDYDLISAAGQIGSKGWGAISTRAPNGIVRAMSIPNPQNLPAEIASKVRAAIKSGTTPAQLVADFAFKEGEDDIAHVSIALEAAAAKIAVLAPSFIKPEHYVQVHFGSPAPGETIPQALSRLTGEIEKQNAGQAVEVPDEDADSIDMDTPVHIAMMLIGVDRALDEEVADYLEEETDFTLGINNMQPLTDRVSILFQDSQATLGEILDLTDAIQEHFNADFVDSTVYTNDKTAAYSIEVERGQEPRIKTFP